MNREWYLIDDDGIHPVDVGDSSDDFWGQFDRQDEQAPWPPFNQLVVDASANRTTEALRQTAPAVGVGLTEVTDRPERWEGALMVARADGLTALAEPGVDLEERVMALTWSETLVAHLRCDAVFFGYDPAAGTLHLTKFSGGATDFAWCDSLVPGPSYAMIFDGEGEVTDEDPRKFALRRLDMPQTSPLLDRYRFVTEELREFGLEQVSPELEEFPVAAALDVEALQRQDGDVSHS